MLTRFAEVCEAIAGTTRKLEKERHLSGYLQGLSDEDMQIACTFLTGSPFPMRDQRTTNVGYAAVRDAVLDVAPDSADRLGEYLLRTGDFGTAVQQLFQQRSVVPSLSLKELLSYYVQLTTASSSQEKRRLTVEMLSRATGLEAKYIVKILLGDMRIGLQESLVESSIARAFGCKLKEVQTANMLTGDIGECAVMARHGQLSRARMRLLHPLKPMLASPEEDTGKILGYMQGRGLAEDKYDGIRAQLHKEEESIKIYSRDLDDITATFPDLLAAFQPVPGSFLMDGEIVPFKDGNILPFAELQKRLGRKVLTSEMLQAIPCRYFAFDVLYSNGELLFEQPLWVRKNRLHEIHHASPGTFSTAANREVKTAEEIEEAFAASLARNNEGLVIKHLDSAYSPGKRGKSWLKLKRAMLTLDVVVVLAEYGHGKRAGYLSDYTFAIKGPNGRLMTIGKAYSGITDEELNRLSELFHSISLENHGYYHVVPPQVVLEVTFDRINKSNRHTSGYALRFPRIKRIRWDKTPDEIDTLATVEDYYNTHFA